PTTTSSTRCRTTTSIPSSPSLRPRLVCSFRQRPSLYATSIPIISFNFDAVMVSSIHVILSAYLIFILFFAQSQIVIDFLLTLLRRSATLMISPHAVSGLQLQHDSPITSTS